MASRNLSEVFVIMRNNAAKSQTHYSRSGDAERLLKHSICDVEEGLELQNDYSTAPKWVDKLEEAQYTMSKIKPKLDELGSLHARHLLRPAFDESCEEETDIETLSHVVSKLITSTHRHIQCIRSSLGIGIKNEQRLTHNVVTCLLLQLQELTTKFRNSQNSYLIHLNSREERSQKYFEDGNFTNVELTNGKEISFVDSFDNFLQHSTTIGSQPILMAQPNSTYLFENGNDFQQQIDQHFQRPVTDRLTHQQLVLFEDDNSRLADHREREVTKVVQTIYDLNDIFKELSQMIQEQGTVLDRIDYNIEQTQTRVVEGLHQLQCAEKYQRKNRKMCVIMVLASITFLMLLVLIFTKI